MPTGRRLVAALVDLAAVLTIATTANFGGLTVVSAAERTCKALITIISQSSPKQVLHHSAKTLAAWAAWNKAHPNYHPPHHSPPMSREQAQRWVDSACAQLMPIDPSQPDIFLEPAPSDGLLADNTAPSTFTLFSEEIPLLLLGTGLLLLAAGMLGAWLRSGRCSWHWPWLRFPASSYALERFILADSTRIHTREPFELVFLLV